MAQPTDQPTNKITTEGNPERREKTNMSPRSRLANLTQHIKREHKESPRLFCSRCRMQFEGDDQQRKFEEHHRGPESRCQPNTSAGPVSVIVTVSEVGFQQIINTRKRGVSPDERWMEIWRILFGGNTKYRLKSAPQAIAGNGLVDIIDWIQSFGEPRTNPDDYQSLYLHGCCRTVVEEMCSDVTASVQRTVPEVPVSTPSLSAALGPTPAFRTTLLTGPMPKHGSFQPPQSHEHAGSLTNPERKDGSQESFSSILNYDASIPLALENGDYANYVDPRLFRPASQPPESSWETELI